MLKIGIIGGGVGGVCAAIALAARGFAVTLLEANSAVLSRTSAMTPGRLGLGFHYPGDESLKTAETTIRASIALKKAFPSAVFTQPLHHSFLCKGWYFITRNSQQPPDDFLNYCKRIREIYRKEVQQSGEALYDNPDNFFRILDFDEYRNSVNTNEVSLGIETQESVLNWKVFSSELLKELQKNNNIRVLTNHRVSHVRSAFREYMLDVVINNETHEQLTFTHVINASYDYRLLIDATLGYFPETGWVNRLKFLVNLDLPEELYQSHSMFFARGPFAMFTNHGEGAGFATYAPVTNYGHVNANDLFPAMWERIIQEGLPLKWQNEMGQKIIQGVANYIPMMKNARIRKVSAGIVQNSGTADIYDKNSGIHKRFNTGIFEYQSGYYSLDIGKLCFGYYYSEMLAKIIASKYQNQK